MQFLKSFENKIRPQLSILIILLDLFLSNGLFARAWQGIWQSNHGALRLMQIDDKVYGDYAMLGTIEGTISGNTSSFW